MGLRTSRRRFLQLAGSGLFIPSELSLARSHGGAWNGITQSAFNPPFPRKALIAVGSSTFYGSTGSWPSDVTNTISRFDAVIIGGEYEGFGTTHGDRNLLVQAMKTGNGNGRAVASQGTKVFIHTIPHGAYPPTGGASPYGIITSPLSQNVTPDPNNDDHPTLTKLISLYNWYGYATGPTGSPYGVSSSYGATPWQGPDGLDYTCFMIDYTNGKPFAGYSGSGERPHELYAKYCWYAYLNKNRTNDARFSGISANDAAPLLDGVFHDNLLRYWQGWSSIDGNRSGSSSSTGFDGQLADWSCAGYYIFFQQLQALAAAAGQTILNFGNFSDFGRSSYTGNGGSTTPGLYNMNQVLHGGLIESTFGYSFSWDTTSPASLISWLTTAIGRTQSPQLCPIGGIRPTSGSNPPIGNMYQWIRYELATCMLLWQPLAFNDYEVNGYEANTVSQIIWPDEYDNAGNVNPYTSLSNGFLGYPLPAGTVGFDGTTNTGQFGGKTLSNGVQVIEFQGGLVLRNPPGNGIQTITTSMVGGSGKWRFINGTQVPSINSGQLWTSSYTIGTSSMDRDGLVVNRA